jgi:hypothetical protein
MGISACFIQEEYWISGSNSGDYKEYHIMGRDAVQCVGSSLDFSEELAVSIFRV